MSTVDDAVEAGARALAGHWRDMHAGESLGRQRALARRAARAMWPTLSDGLRSKAELHAIGAHARGSEEERDWLDLIHLIDRTDKELGL